MIIDVGSRGDTSNSDAMQDARIRIEDKVWGGSAWRSKRWKRCWGVGEGEKRSEEKVEKDMEPDLLEVHKEAHAVVRNHVKLKKMLE